MTTVKPDSGAMGMPRFALTALLLALLFLLPTPSGAVTITRTSGGTFYTDTSTTSPGTPSCGYVSFNIYTPTAIADAWATIGSFGGGSFSLGGGDTGAHHMGALAAGQTIPAFFYLCSSYSTLNNSGPQGYQVGVYNGNPSSGGTSVGSANFSTTIDNNVITANANQVYTIVSGPNPPEVGGLVTMTVSGATGTVGCVNPPSSCTGAAGGPLAFTPATFTDWRADAFVLTASSITFSGGNPGTFDNTLYLDSLPGSSTSQYVATYYFRTMSPTGVTTSLSPVSYLASGTQIKHTSLSNGAYSTGGGIQPIPSPQVTVFLTKTVNQDTLPAGGGKVTYTITATNTGLVAISLDTFVDTLPGGASYVATTSTFNGATLADPTISGNTLTWPSQFNIPAGGTGKLAFQVNLPSPSGAYTNSATATIGTTLIDATVQLGDNVPATITTTVLQPPTISETISPSALAINSPGTMTITITNPNTGHTMNGVAVSDTLPNGLTFTSSADAGTTCSGASLVFSPGTISISGGTLAAGQSCTLTAKLSSPNVNASYTNTTGPVSSTNCGTGSTASAAVSITTLPTVTKSFAAPATIAQGGTIPMNITLNSPVPLTGIVLNDLFPAGMVTANPPSVSPAAPCGGTLGSWNGTLPGTLNPAGGDPGIQLSSGTIASAGGSCSFSVNVTAAPSGAYNNTTAGVTANETGNTPGPVSNTATLTVLSPPTVSKAFSPSTIDKGGTSTLIITLSNANSSAISGVGFTDSFPANVKAAATPNLGTSCAALSSLQYTAGSVTLSGGTIPAAVNGVPGSCTVTIDVTSSTVNASPGYQNTIAAGTVTSANAGSNSTPASATLIVNATPSITKSFSFNAASGVGTMNIVITNNFTSGVSGLSFKDLFPSGMTTANPPAVTPASPCGGSLLSWNGSSTGALSSTGGDAGIALSGGQILSGGGSCSFSVNLAVSGQGVYTNQASGVTVSYPFSGTGSPSNSAVWIAPRVDKTLSPKSNGPGDASLLTISITNPSQTDTLTGVSLSDSYPTSATKPDGSTLSASMTNTATPGASSSNCGTGAVVTAVANGSGISLSGATILPSQTCTFSAYVQATNSTPATYNNTTGKAASLQGIGTAGSDTLSVVITPTISKSFETNPTTFSGSTATSVLAITVSNNSGVAISNLSFSDSFPSTATQGSSQIAAQMKYVNTVSNSCGASSTLTDQNGSALVANSSTGIRLNSGSISTGSGSCVIKVTVSVPAPGSYDNTTTGATSSANTSPGSPSNKATLTANLPAPTVTKSFASPAFQKGGTDRLTITIANNSSAFAMSGVSFTDNYPSNLLNLVPVNLYNTCGGTASGANSSGGASLSLSGGSVPAGGSCYVWVDTTSSQTAPYTNTLPAYSVTATAVNPAPPAPVSASITSYSPPTVAKGFGSDHLIAGQATTMWISVTNPQENQGAITSLRLDDTFPAGLSLQDTTFTFSPTGCGSVTNTLGTASAAGDGNLRLSVSSLAPNTSCQVTVNVTSSTIGPITNNTGAPTASGPATLTGSGNSASITIYGLPNLKVVKSADKTNVSPGQLVTYTISVTNNGTGPGTGVVLTDTLNPYCSFYLGTKSPWTADSPFTFTDTTSGSTLSLGTVVYSSDSYSTNPSALGWGYPPVSGGGGAPQNYDGAVTHWRVNMKNSMNPGENFTLQYKVLIK